MLILQGSRALLQLISYKHTHTDTRCSNFGKMGHEAATCLSKAKKDTQVNFALGGEAERETEDEQGQEAVSTGEQVTIIVYGSESEGADDVVMTIKWGVNGQALQKNPIQWG